MESLDFTRRADELAPAVLGSVLWRGQIGLRLTEVEAYLVRNNLFADEPSRISGKAYTEYSVVIDTATGKLPLALVRYELARMGARGIDTIPLTSSIPSIGAIEDW